MKERRPRPDDASDDESKLACLESGRGTDRLDAADEEEESSAGAVTVTAAGSNSSLAGRVSASSCVEQ